MGREVNQALLVDGSTRLVTLSACEIGIPDFHTASDKFVGLLAGFPQAGAPGVIATL